MWNSNQQSYTTDSGIPRGSGRKKRAPERQLERRRALQARYRAAVVRLYDDLGKAVFPASKKAPAKWKILSQAKHFLRQRESQVSTLLELKEMFLVGEGRPFTLEDVREEYRNLYPICSYRSTRHGGSGPILTGVQASSEDEPGKVQSFSPFTPSILEFEGYLSFYRQTLELLQLNRVLSPVQTHLPVVSEAISALWKSLPPERRAAFQTHGPEWSAQPQTSSPQVLSQANSQGTSGSSGSTLEEDLFQDACEVVQRDVDSTSEDSPPLEFPEASDTSGLTEIYRNIMCFMKTQEAEQWEHTQDRCLVADHETVFLRCTETFDDEDL